jgi:hypothetical protein
VTTSRVWQGVSIGSIGFLIGAILYLVFFSTIVGIVFGFITAYLVRKLFTIPRQQTPSYEVALMVVMAFMSYYVSTLFGLSGILTIFVCGVIDSHYTWYVRSAALVVCLNVLSVLAVRLGERRVEGKPRHRASDVKQVSRQPSGFQMGEQGHRLRGQRAHPHSPVHPHMI